MGEAPVRVQVRTLQSCSVVTFSQLAGQSVVGGSSALRERERETVGLSGRAAPAAAAAPRSVQ